MRWELVERKKDGVKKIGGRKKKMPALPPENAGIIQRLFKATFYFSLPLTSPKQSVVRKVLPRNKSRCSLCTNEAILKIF